MVDEDAELAIGGEELAIGGEELAIGGEELATTETIGGHSRRPQGNRWLGSTDEYSQAAFRNAMSAL